MKKSTQAEVPAVKQPENAPPASAGVAIDESETPEPHQAAPELPESEASQTIRKVRKLMTMPNVPDEDLLYYLKVVLKCPENSANTSGDVLLSDVADAINKAAKCPEVAQNLARIKERIYRVDHPDEFSECEELIFSGVDVDQIIRRTEIESAEATAFDMVRLFLNKYSDAKAGLALFSVAAGFAAK